MREGGDAIVVIAFNNWPRLATCSLHTTVPRCKVHLQVCRVFIKMLDIAKSINTRPNTIIIENAGVIICILFNVSM